MIRLPDEPLEGVMVFGLNRYVILGYIVKACSILDNHHKVLCRIGRPPGPDRVLERK